MIRTPGPVQGPQARARPAPDLPPQRRAHPRPYHALLPALVLVGVAETTTGDTWPQLRQGLERMHLGESAGRAGASPSAPRPPPASGSCAPWRSKNRSWRSTCRPSGRAADGASVRVGTTRHPAWSHQACSQASSADPFTNNCRTRSNICAACVAGYHHPNDDGLVLSPRRGVERCQCECRTK